MMFLKKIPIGLVIIEIQRFFFLIYFFIVKCVLMLLKFWIIHVFEYFINSIENFLLTLVDNLETYIKNENFKDSLRKILSYVCVYRCLLLMYIMLWALGPITLLVQHTYTCTILYLYHTLMPPI